MAATQTVEPATSPRTGDLQPEDQRMMGVLALMLLADGRLPVGGHTQSSGLEPASLAGLTVEQVPGFLETRLRTCVTVDAGTAVVARHLVLSRASVGIAQAAWLARTPSEVARASSIAVGRGYVRLAKRLWPLEKATKALAGLSPAPARPVAVGAIGAAAGLSASEVAALVCYEDVQTASAAALKLYPYDPMDATGLLLRLGPVIAEVVASVAHLTEASGIPAPSAPLMEVWVDRHASQPRRLFSA